MDITTRICHGSEIPALVEEIASLRDNGKAEAEYRAELRKYNRRRRGRPEVTFKHRIDDFFVEERTGFQVRVMGQNVYVPRPWCRNWQSWVRYEGFTGGMREVGLLAGGGKLNRPLLPSRVGTYHDLMQAGKWRDLLSDPISITADGEVLNGQHRIAAAQSVDWDKAGNDPAFMILFGVNPDEVYLTDRSKRTGRDIFCDRGQGETGMWLTRLISDQGRDG
jgi:hypothetical protein